MTTNSNFDVVTALGDVIAKKNDMVEANGGGTAVHEKKAKIESDIGADIGGVVDVAMTDDGPQLPSSPGRDPFSVPSHIDVMDPLADALTPGEREGIETSAGVGGFDGGVSAWGGGVERSTNGNAELVEENINTDKASSKIDGKKIGEALITFVEGEKLSKRKEEIVSDFIGKIEKGNDEDMSALRAVVEKYPWFETVLKRAVLGEVSRNHLVSKKLEEIGEREALVIGNNLTPCLKSRKIVEAGVDQWRLQNAAVEELFGEYPWMNGMFVVVGYGVVRGAPWGLKMRVTVGAATSMTDLLTDVYVTYMFWSDKKYGYFKASLASLAVSMGIQMICVWLQNRRLGMLRVLREWFPILIGFKPAVDAYRVAKGEKQEAGQVMDALTELTLMKVIEMFAEAIPGVIIQLMAIATSEKKVADAAWVSLSVSAITTGFASATISYDYDTAPLKREQVPGYYGYVPANPTKRSILFVSMMLFSAGMLLIRSMIVVVLGLLGGRWVFLYVGADLGLYLLVKIFRGDFWYWAPLGGNTEILSSIICRLLVKVVTDFTSIVQFRHPNEVGGMYWMFGFVLTMGSLPVAIILAERGDVADEVLRFAWKIVGIFIPCTIVLFTVFFFSIEKKYWGTFYSLQRGQDLTVKKFKEGNESVKADAAFGTSKHHWKSIEEDVKAWVEANWVRWEEEKPKWFNEAMRARVPVKYIPGAGDARRRESVTRASVDAEAEGGLTGALRASIRRASVGGAGGGDIIGIRGGKAKVSSVLPIEDEKGE
jgi:hypothetical protein